MNNEAPQPTPAPPAIPPPETPFQTPQNPEPGQIPLPPKNKPSRLAKVFIAIAIIPGTLFVVFILFYLAIPKYQTWRMSIGPNAKLLLQIEQDVLPPKGTSRSIDYVGSSGGLEDMFDPPRIIPPTSLYYSYTSQDPVVNFKTKLDTKKWKLVEDRIDDEAYGTQYKYINTSDYSEHVCITGNYNQKGAFSEFSRPSLSIDLASGDPTCKDTGIILGRYDKDQKLFDFGTLPQSVTVQSYSVRDAEAVGDNPTYTSMYGRSEDLIYFILTQIKHTGKTALPDSCAATNNAATQGYTCERIGTIKTGESIYLKNSTLTYEYRQLVVVIEGTEVTLMDRSTDPSLAAGSTSSKEVDLIADVIDQRIPIKPERFRELSATKH